MADLHLPVKPRSDIALLNGIAHILIREGLIDRDYIDAHTTGFEEFSSFFVVKFTPERVADHRPHDEQIAMSRALYGHAKRRLHRLDHGRESLHAGRRHRCRHQQPCADHRQYWPLGASPFSITGQCNAMGTREAGFTSSLPGYRNSITRRIARIWPRLWNIDVRPHPHCARPRVSRHYRSRGLRQD